MSTLAIADMPLWWHLARYHDTVKLAHPYLLCYSLFPKWFQSIPVGNHFIWEGYVCREAPIHISYSLETWRRILVLPPAFLHSDLSPFYLCNSICFHLCHHGNNHCPPESYLSPSDELRCDKYRIEPIIVFSPLGDPACLPKASIKLYQNLMSQMEREYINCPF